MPARVGDKHPDAIPADRHEDSHNNAGADMDSMVMDEDNQCTAAASTDSSSIGINET